VLTSLRIFLRGDNKKNPLRDYVAQGIMFGRLSGILIPAAFRLLLYKNRKIKRRKVKIRKVIVNGKSILLLLRLYLAHLKR